MKLIRLAPLALAVFSAAASADMFTANLYDVNNINQDVIDSRLSMSGPLFNGWDRTFKQGDPWVEAYGMTHRINRTGDFGKFKNKGAGGVFGYDHVIADNFRLGLALNGGAGKLKWYDNEGEDDLKIDSHWYGANLYGTWTGKKVNVIANLGYTHQKDDGKHDIEDRNSHALNAGLRFETSFVAGGISFVPYYGVRFTHLSNGALKSDGTDNLEPGETPEPSSVNMSGSNIWQFPVGVNAGFEYTCAAGWKSRTMIDLAVIPTAGKRKTYFSGEEGGSGRFANSVTYRGKVGLQLTKGQHSFGFMYGAAAGAHGSFGQNVTLNYHFMY